MLTCRLLGHRYRFSADGPTMRWECARGCGAAHSKDYASAAEAARYARSFDRDDRNELGARAPISVLPLRLLRRFTDRRRAP